MTNFIFSQRYKFNLPSLSTQLIQFALKPIAISQIFGYLIHQHTRHASLQCVTLAGFPLYMKELSK
jgi:hypothetical protein